MKDICGRDEYLHSMPHGEDQPVVSVQQPVVTPNYVRVKCGEVRVIVVSVSLVP